MSGIVVVGSCNIDLITYTTELPRPGETIFGRDFQKGFGGKGANQCVMAGKLCGEGDPVTMVAALGDDSFGREYLDEFRRLGINTDWIKVVPRVPSGVAAITVQDKGENSIIVVPGANLCLDADDVHKVADVFSGARVMLTQLEVAHATALAGLRVAKAHGCLTMLTPAPVPDVLDRAFFDVTDILVANRVETLSLAKGCAKVAGNEALPEVIAAGRTLLEWGCKAIVVTLGGDGSMVLLRNNASIFEIPAVHVEHVIDTTGAGDAFCGSLAYFLSKTVDRGTDPCAIAIVEAVQRATYIAAQTVMKKGTQCSYPQRHDLPSTAFCSAADSVGVLPKARILE